MVIVPFVTSDDNKNDFISGKMQHVDSAVPAWFVVSPAARGLAKLGVTSVARSKKMSIPMALEN